MNIIDMKGKSNEKDLASQSTSKEDYPYGLRINLNDEAITALGLNFNRFKSGVGGKLTCEYVCTGKSENEYDGKINRELTLQITGMSKPSVAKKDRMKTGADLLNQMRKNK